MDVGGFQHALWVDLISPNSKETQAVLPRKIAVSNTKGSRVGTLDTPMQRSDTIWQVENVLSCLEPYLAKKSPNSNLKPEVRVNKRATKPRSEALLKLKHFKSLV
jgi:hypothetical protein